MSLQGFDTNLEHFKKIMICLILRYNALLILAFWRREMTLIIENVKGEYLSAFKGFAKESNAKLRAKSSKDSLDSSETIPALDKAIREIVQGESIKFSNHSEMMKYLQSDDK